MVNEVKMEILGIVMGILLDGNGKHDGKLIEKLSCE